MTTTIMRFATVRLLLIALLTALLGGCASRSLSGSSSMSERDGPEANPPPDLLRVPDAEPKLEAIRLGGANKPYVVFGQRYEPLTQDLPYREQGLASWYGRLYHGKPTANGEPYDMYAMTAAHPTLPIPSYARIRNPANGREVVVRINDRGPFRSGRIVDLSYTAALKLDVLRGVAPVELERVTFEDIRTGAWRRGRGEQPEPVLAAPSAVPPEPVLAAQSAVLPQPVLTAPSAVLPQPLLAAVGATPAAAQRVASSESTASLPVAAAPTMDAPPSPAVGLPAPGYWLQLGAFRQRDGALTFQRQVEAQVAWLAPLLTVVDDAALFKLQAGPYASRDAARDAAGRLRAALQLVPVVIERR